MGIRDREKRHEGRNDVTIDCCQRETPRKTFFYMMITWQNKLDPYELVLCKTPHQLKELPGSDSEFSYLGSELTKSCLE